MKTIRTNTFETNSSSTHSVTFRSRSKRPSADIKPLVSDGVLLPENLGRYFAGFGESSILVADSKDKKAALVAHWVYSLEDYEEVPREKLETALAVLAEECGYSSIKPLDYAEFSPSIYDGEEYADDAYRSDLIKGNIGSFKRFIKKIVLDDDQEILDSTTPN